MVRAIPNNPWRCADFLERVRPGFAVSAALHIGLLIVLAYLLAFHPTLQVQTDKTDPPVVLIEIPKPPPPGSLSKRKLSCGPWSPASTTRNSDTIRSRAVAQPTPIPSALKRSH